MFATTGTLWPNLIHQGCGTATGSSAGAARLFEEHERAVCAVFPIMLTPD